MTRLADLRAFVQDALCRPAQSAPPPRWLAGLLFSAWTLLCLDRTGFTVALDTVWAEDGAVFLSDAVTRNSLALLFEGQAGYLQPLPRLISAVAPLLSLQADAVLFSMAGAMLAASAGLLVLYASRGHIRSPGIRIGLASYVVLLPVVGVEAPNSIVYAQFFLSLAVAWCLLCVPGTRRASRALAAALASIAMTAPTTLALLPLAAVTAWAGRPTQRAPSTAFAGGAVVQLLFILAHSPGSPSSMSSETALVFIQRVLGGLFAGDAANVALWNLLGVGRHAVLMGVLGLGFFTFLFGVSGGIGTRATRLVLAAFGLSALGFFLFSAVARGPQSGVPLFPLAWREIAQPDSARHVMAPVFLLASGAAIAADRILHMDIRRAWLPTAAVCAVALLAVGSSLNVPATLRAESSWGHALADAQAECSTSGADRVRVALAPPGWSVPLPCEEILHHKVWLFRRPGRV